MLRRCSKDDVGRTEVDCRIILDQQPAVTISTGWTEAGFRPSNLNTSASLRHASATSTGRCLATSFPNSAGCMACSTVESVVLLQDRPSQQPSSDGSNCESHPYTHGTDLAKRVVHASASGESRAFNGAGTKQENTKPTNMTVNDNDQRKYPMQIVSTIPAAAHARPAQNPRVIV